MEIKAVQAGYYGDTNFRTPPPDLESLLLKERIIYLGLPLFSSDEIKQQVGIDVTQLIIAQLLYLQFDNPEKPIYFYINSTGTSWYTGDAIGFETEALAMILSAGTKGCRASLPHATIVLNQNRSGAQGQATDIQIRAKEVLQNKQTMLTILAENTGQTAEKIAKDIDRTFYLTPAKAKEYGLIDRVLESTKELPKALSPVG